MLALACHLTNNYPQQGMTLARLKPLLRLLHIHSTTIRRLPLEWRVIVILSVLLLISTPPWPLDFGPALRCRSFR